MDRTEHKFMGKILFTFASWDEISVAFLQFNDVQFSFKSMEKYNGHMVSLDLSGEMEVYDDIGEVIWSGFPIEIEEWDD